MYALVLCVIGVGNVAISRQSAVGAESAGPLQREKEAEAWQLVGHLVPPRPALLSSLPEPPEERVLELLPVLGDQGVVEMAGVQAQVVMVEAMLALLQEGLQSLTQ